MTTFSIYCSPYRAIIYFCITEDKERAKRYFKQSFKLDVGDSEFVAGYCLKYNNDACIWLPKLPCSATDYEALYHEVYHAVCNILQSRGVYDRGEPYAYLLGFVIRVFYEKFPPIITRKFEFNIFGKNILTEVK